VEFLSSFAQPMSSEAVDAQQSPDSELKMKGFPAWTWEKVFVILICQKKIKKWFVYENRSQQSF
jgi:hypothetical protein